MLAFDPGQVIHELPAVDRFEPEAGPLHADLSVGNISRERHVRRACRLVDESALVGTPKLIRPARVSGDRRTAHEPAVP